MAKLLGIVPLFISLFFSTHVAAHEIGEYYLGGIIFWVEKTDKVERGLIASSSDTARNIKWANREYATGAIQDGLFVGKENTKKIINALGPSGNYAAKIAAYGDWYLPSKYELNLMFEQRFIIGEFAIGNSSDINGCNIYWSSTETKIGKAWSQSFETGKTNDESACGQDGMLGHVRAIRSYEIINTTFECSVVSGLNNKSSGCGIWSNSDNPHAICSGNYIGSPSTGYKQPVFECTVKNGSIRVDAYNFIQNNNNGVHNFQITNGRYYFYGVAKKPAQGLTTEIRASRW